MATASTSSAASASSSTAPDGSREYVVRMPQKNHKKYSILKFNPSNNVDFVKCGAARLERENNLKQYKMANDIDVLPQFGAGSEFGREQREEARRKKYGIQKKSYNPEDQPWLLKLGSSKPARKFKGLKEGGITENASYFIFKQSTDGAFEAFPLTEWYNFTPVAKYKKLNAEEAEEEFTRRDKTLNYFSIMVKKRLKKDEEGAGDDGEEAKQKTKASKSRKDLVLTEMDEWTMMTDDSDDNSDDSADAPKKPKAKKSKKVKVRKMAKKKGSDAEAEEESDDVDEGKEVDYMTDTDSEDDDMYATHVKTDKYEGKGVEDEDGLRKAIESDEEEETKEEEDEASDQEAPEEKPGKASDTDSSSSESDSDTENITSALFMEKKAKRKSASADNSRSSTPSIDPEKKSSKRKAEASTSAPASKKPNIGLSRPTTSAVPSGTEGINEDAVRRYLMRKPMTTKDLLQKFRSKNPDISKEKLVTCIANILKKINPEKKKIQDKLFLFIKKT